MNTTTSTNRRPILTYGITLPVLVLPIIAFAVAQGLDLDRINQAPVAAQIAIYGQAFMPALAALNAAAYFVAQAMAEGGSPMLIGETGALTMGALVVTVAATARLRRGRAAAGARIAAPHTRDGADAGDTPKPGLSDAGGTAMPPVRS
jgi:hypothetical protein